MFDTGPGYTPDEIEYLEAWDRGYLDGKDDRQKGYRHRWLFWQSDQTVTMGDYGYQDGYDKGYEYGND